MTKDCSYAGLLGCSGWKARATVLDRTGTVGLCFGVGCSGWKARATCLDRTGQLVCVLEWGARAGKPELRFWIAQGSWLVFWSWVLGLESPSYGFGSHRAVGLCFGAGCSGWKARATCLDRTGQLVCVLELGARAGKPELRFWIAQGRLGCVLEWGARAGKPELRFWIAQGSWCVFWSWGLGLESPSYWGLGVSQYSQRTTGLCPVTTAARLDALPTQKPAAVLLRTSATAGPTASATARPQ